METRTCHASTLRRIILESQHLLTPSTASIDAIVSDLCGLQYDPNPTIHLNQYMMLWNRRKDFTVDQLDRAAYRDFDVLETWTFRRNMFFVPRKEYALYKAACGGIVRWGQTDADWLTAGDGPEIRTAERELTAALTGVPGMTVQQIWETLGLSAEWRKYRREHDQSYNLPLFRAFYRLVRRGELLTCGRNPGTFREPVYILRENLGFADPADERIDAKQAIRWMIEKLVRALGITDPIHVSHISGYRTAELAPVFAELAENGKIEALPYKIGRRQYYIHTDRTPLLTAPPALVQDGVRLISPMDTVVRDKVWLETFFDYSFSFEYFRKKGMKWPLSILLGDRFVGYLDCKMEWRTGKLVVKERNIFDSDLREDGRIEAAIRALAAFHGAAAIEEGSFTICTPGAEN